MKRNKTCTNVYNLKINQINMVQINDQVWQHRPFKEIGDLRRKSKEAETAIP